MKTWSILLLCLTLAACASGARPEKMMPTLSGSAIGQTEAAYQSSAVGKVDGGHDTNPLLWSDVSSKDFEKALHDTLAARGLLAPKDADARYQIDAHIVDLDRPIFAFDTTVGSTVHYTVRDRTKNDVVLDVTVTEKGTATMGQQFIGVLRLQLAVEESLKNNIANFVGQLVPALNARGAEPAAKVAPTS